ncbi:MAG: 5'-methylthioadenosine/adenosylhomocysteine nucleosidase [Muribaculaceae bacterium]|jgi:adenosylhomocysteine nucleosidase|nr:5'-methylthioadenosine/adenosylhomocysteine nucleosidase [Muribaculaceae bacterium]HUN21093.1 5'-methylthioadenosine/adenosylhomocysteine nucleosidase [Muribaculaceae bacterium]
MKVGIIVAMGKELNLLLPLIENVEETTVNGFLFHTGRIGGREIVAMQCGIGKVNAAIGTMTMIETFHPSLIINSGVAGGTGNGARILDVVVGTRIAYHDVWCGPGTEWGVAAGCPCYFTCPDWITALPALTPGKGLYHGLICSGDIFVSDPDIVDGIRRHFPDVMAVDMESAAIAQVCHIKGTGFIAIRVISDTPGEADNIAQYENFWDDAPKRTFETVERLLTQL